MKKTIKKTNKKVGKKKKISLFASKKKTNSSNIKMAFYIVFIIVVLFVLYFVNFKKPRQAATNDSSVITEIFNPEGSKVIQLPSTFKVYKQSDVEESGPACIMVLLSYYGNDGIFTEEIVKGLKSAHEPFHIGTCVNQIQEILTTLKIKYWTDENYKEIPNLSNEKVGISLIEKIVDEGYPILVGWNRKPGQWSLVVGYDNKSTDDKEDDVITMINTDSEPNTDVYLKVPAKEFNEKWTFDNVFIGEPTAQARSNKCFVIVEKN